MARISSLSTASSPRPSPGSCHDLNLSDAASYSRGLGLGLGQHVPSSELGAVCQQIELLWGRKAPKLPQQRRLFIDTWFNKQQQAQQDDALPLSRPSTPASIGSGGMGGSLRSRPAPRIDRNSLLMYGAQGGKQNTQLLALLSQYEEASELASPIMVPTEHLAIVTEQVEAITGKPAPRQPQARHDYLAAAYLRALDGAV